MSRRRVVQIAIRALRQLLPIPFLLQGGCQHETPSPSVALGGAQASAGTDSAMAGAASPAAPAAVIPAADASPATAAIPTEPYKPPFPDRHDLFRVPRIDAQSGAATQATDVVILRGIVEFGGTHALLEVNGVVQRIQPRQQLGGVEVLSIDPPRVVLQRGNRRWTESLYPPLD